MARVDYGGDGATHTRDPTLISFCDRFGIHACEGDGSAIAFEAAWGTDGAFCIAHPRIPEIVTLEALAERYPKLAARLGPAACTLQSAMREPSALLFNRSGNSHHPKGFEKPVKAYAM